MTNRLLSPLLAVLLVVGLPGTAAGQVAGAVSAGSEDRVPPQCRKDPNCGPWAYLESEGPSAGRSFTTDTDGVGEVQDRDTWEYSDTIRYGKGAQEVGTVFVLVNLSVDDHDRHRLFFVMRSEVESGPAVKMTHRYGCREDDFRDRACEGGPGATEDASPAFRDDFQTDDFVQHPRDKRDKIFWNFGFRWEAAGIDDCCFFIPRQTSKRYECAGPEIGCFFDRRSSD